MPSIATNVAANSSLFYLNRNSTNQSASLSKISSGSRIVSAKDDAAGAAIADQLQSDITSLEVAGQTVQQVEALLQVADGGLQRVSDILQRIKGLATQYNSGTVDATSQGFIEAEFDLLKNEINLIETSTTYNGTALLDGTFNNNVVVGAAAADVIAVDLSGVNVDATSLALPGNFSGAADITTVEAAIAAIGTDRATVGSLQSAISFQGEVVATQIENLQAAKASISDVDIAAEQTRFTNFQVLTEAAIAGLAQANQITQSLLSLLR